MEGDLVTLEGDPADGEPLLRPVFCDRAVLSHRYRRWHKRVPTPRPNSPACRRHCDASSRFPPPIR
jgi:hypothetical protein